MVFRQRVAAESLLEHTVEGYTSSPVRFDAKGVVVDTSVNDGLPLRGTVYCDDTVFSYDTGASVHDSNPFLVMRKSSMSQIPTAGDGLIWRVALPKILSEPEGPKKYYRVNTAADATLSKTSGKIMFFLRELENTHA